MKQNWVNFHPFRVRDNETTRHFSNLQCAARSALDSGGTVVNMNTGQMWAGRSELMAAMQPPIVNDTKGIQ